MALLDAYFSNPGTANALGILAARLMAGGAPSTDPGASGRAWGAGMADYNQAMTDAKTRGIIESLRQAQLKQATIANTEAERKMQGQQALQDALTGRPGGDAFDKALATGPGGVEQLSQAIKPTGVYDPATMESTRRAIQAAMAQADPEGTAKSMLNPKLTAVSPGASLVGPDGKPVYTNPNEAPSLNRYQYVGPWTDENGKYLGTGSFQHGKIMLNDGTRTFEPPPGARPQTASGLNTTVLTGQNFGKLQKEATDAQSSLRGMDRFISRVKDVNQGLSLQYDKIAGDINALLGQRLTPEQLQTKIASGEMQGLIGKLRVETLGPGVVTEFDAKRILMAAGSALSPTQAKEAAVSTLAQIMREKVLDYNNRIVPLYNAQVHSRYGAEGFAPLEPVNIDWSKAGIVEPSSSMLAPGQAGKTPPLKPASSGGGWSIQRVEP